MVILSPVIAILGEISDAWSLLGVEVSLIKSALHILIGGRPTLVLRDTSYVRQ